MTDAKELPGLAAPSALERFLGTLSTCIPILALLLSIAWLTWSFERGFDITDEGYYLLSASNPGANEAPTNGFFHWYTSLLLGAAGGSLFGFRVLGLLLLLVTGLFFAVQYMRTIERIAPRILGPLARPAWVAFLLLAVIAFYSRDLASPGYNLLNLAGVLVTAGALLRALSVQDDSRHRWAWLVLAGIGIGFVLWTKWPTGLAMLVVLVPFACLWTGQTMAQRAQAAGCMLGGFAGWVGLNLLLVQSPGDTIDRFSRSLDYLLPLGSRHGDGILGRTIEQGLAIPGDLLARYTVTPLVLAVIPALMLLAYRRSGRVVTSALAGIVACTAAMVVVELVLGDAQGGSVGRGIAFLNASAWLIFWTVLSLLVVLAARSRTDRFDEPAAVRFIFPWLLLVMVPFLYAAGTGRPLTSTAEGAVIGFFAASGLVLALLGSVVNRAWIPLLGLAAMSIVLAGSIFTSGNAPYRLATPTWGQVEAIAIDPDGHEILVDPQTASALEQLQTLARKHDMPPGQDMLGIMSVPGLVYMLGGSAPGVPWLYGGYEGSVPAALAALETVPADQRGNAWLILADNAALAPEQVEQLTGRAFPSGYRFLGQAYWPVDRQMIQLWKPVKTALPGGSTHRVSAGRTGGAMTLDSTEDRLGELEVGGIHGVFEVETNEDDTIQIKAVSPAEDGRFVIQFQLADSLFDRASITGPSLVIFEGLLEEDGGEPYSPSLFIQEQVGPNWYRHSSRLPGRLEGPRHMTMRVVEPGDSRAMLGLTWSPVSPGDTLLIRELAFSMTPLEAHGN